MAPVPSTPPTPPRLPITGAGGGSGGVAGVGAGGVEVVRVTPDLELSAAGRLVSEGAGPRAMAARRMLTAAAMHGIDLSLMWATVERGGKGAKARQVCLAVPGAGRTIMVIVSGPGGGEEGAERRERAACIAAACEFFGSGRAGRGGGEVKLAQALPEPQEPWAVAALMEAGFTRVGDLAYLRRPLLPPLLIPEPVWPAGVTVRNLGGLKKGEPDRAVLLEALNRSYEETLDCPELCGLRETEDILESHLATGAFDPRLWWVVTVGGRGGRGEGCVLLSHCPEHGSVELVYLGLSRELRGKGLGRELLDFGLSRLGVLGVAADHLTCAVDLRNVPARRVYERSGFREFGRRVAMVRAIGGAGDVHNG